MVSCCRCCGLCVGSFLTTLLLAFLLPWYHSPDWFIYYQDWVLHKVGGVRYHLDQDKNGSGFVTHARKLVVLRYKEVERRLSELPIVLEAEQRSEAETVLRDARSVWRSIGPGGARGSGGRARARCVL